MKLPRFIRKQIAFRRISRELPFNLASLEADLREDEQVVLTALRFPWNFEHASPKLRSSPQFVRKALEASPGVLQFSPEWARRDRELVMRAVGRASGALAFADSRFREDKDLILRALNVEIREVRGGEVKSKVYALAVERLRGDPEVKEAVARFEAHVEEVKKWQSQR